MRAATFTTYINAQTDPGLEAAFSRQATVATASYATITRAAQEATRATAGLLGGRGTAGAQTVTRDLTQRAAATQRITAAAADAERATTRLVVATRRESVEAAAAARNNQALAKSLNTTATALNVVQGPLGPLAGRVGALSRAVTELTGARLGLAAFAGGLFAFGSAANDFANIESKLRPYFATQKQVNAALNDVVGIAARSKAALEPVVDVYTRLTAVGQGIGLSAQRISSLTEVSTKAVAIGGGTAQARDAALVQFGQALSGDFKAAGQEINSLKEQAPILFQAILRGYRDVDGKVGVSLARFKKLAEDGQLSTVTVLDAVARSTAYIDQMAARLPNTLSRARTEFSNAVTVSAGQFDQSIGFTRSLADGLSLVANNLRSIIALAAGAAAGFATMKLSPTVASGFKAITDRADAAKQFRNAELAGTVSRISTQGRDLAVARNADIEAQAVKRSAETQVESLRRVVALRQAQALGARENLAIAQAESTVAVSSRGTRTAALEASVVAAKAEQEAIAAVVTEQTAADRATITGYEQKLAASRAYVAQKQAEFDKAVAQKVDARLATRGFENAATFLPLAAQPGAADAGYRQKLIADNSRALAAARVAEARATVVAAGAAKRLDEAMQSATVAQRQYGVAARSANESARVGIGRLSQAERAARTLAAAQRDLVAATEAYTLAQARTKNADLAAATTRVANANARAGLSFLAVAEAQAVASRAAAVAAGTATALERAQKALAASVAFTSRLMTAARSTVGALAGAFFNFNTIVAIATTALLLYATSTSSADKAMQTLKITQDDVAERFGKIARQAANATEETKNFARAQITTELAGKRKAAEDLYEDARARIRTAAVNAARDGDAAAAQRIANIQTLIDPSKPLRGANTALQAEARRNPQFFRRNSLFGYDLTRDSSVGTIVNSLATADTGAAAYNRALAAGRAAVGSINTGGAGKPVPQVRTKAQLDADASAEARRNSGNTLTAAAGRRDTALNALEAQFPKGGKTLDEQKQYLDARRTILSTYEQERQGIAETRKAAGAAATQAKKEARDALQDAKDAAGRTRDDALISLEKRRPQITAEQYQREGEAIAAAFDKTVNGLDESAAASNSAAGVILTNLRKVREAAAAGGEKRSDILGGYDDSPKAIDRARDQIDDLRKLIGTQVDGIAKITAENPLGRGLYTEEVAAADAQRIYEGVRKPLRDIERDYYRTMQLASLQLQGRDAEAAALAKRNQLLDAGVEITQEEYAGLIRNEQQQERINDALASRQRVVGLITGAVDNARDSLEQLLVDARTDGPKAGVAFVKSLQQQFFRIQARQITEKIFAGSDEKVRALVSGKSAVDRTIGQFSTSITKLDSGAKRAEDGLVRFANAAEAVSQRLDVLNAAPNGAGLPVASNDNAGQSGDILVVGSRLADAIIKAPAVAQPSARGQSSLPDLNATPLTYRTPSAAAVYNNIGSAFLSPVSKGLDSIVDKIKGTKTSTLEDGTKIGGSSFFKKIGDSFGTALQGAGQGAIASGFVKALGIKQSKTGAEIGGAIGGLTGIPGGGFIGGIIGGTIGGLFKKTAQGSAGISINGGFADGGVATGTKASARAAATGLAGSVATGLHQISEALGVDLTGSSNVKIGTYKDQIRVSTNGTPIGGKGSVGAKTFATEQEAVEYAIRDAISDGVLPGISAASKRILTSGQELQRALNKATAIESIPKRLLALTNPVQYAVQTLNDEFSKLISYLKEGGATATQFADAQKLYELERAEAVKQATAQAGEAIDQFLKDMVGGSSSPLNKRTTYDNASNDLNAFRSDIAAGKVVDQSALLTSARNFQDASRALNGSSQDFFSDFDSLRSLLMKARDNAGITDVSNLPASPFANDSTVQAAIASLSNGQAAQTTSLVQKLDEVVQAINAAGGVSNPSIPSYKRYDSSVDLLPGFNVAS